MPSQEGDEKRQGYYYEEWEAGDSRRLPFLRHQDVPNWKGINHNLGVVDDKRSIFKISTSFG
jgi:hypothetical protein